MSFITDNYLDISGIITNEIIGDLWLTAFLVLLVVVVVAVYRKIPTEALMVLMIPAFNLVYKMTGLEAFYVLSVLAAGLLFYWMVSKAMG